MNAPLPHPVIPAAQEQQETATFRCKCGCVVSPDDIPCQPDYGVCSITEAAAAPAPKPAVVHIDLDFWDTYKVARVWSPYDHGGR